MAAYIDCPKCGLNKIPETCEQCSSCEITEKYEKRISELEEKNCVHLPANVEEAFVELSNAMPTLLEHLEKIANPPILRLEGPKAIPISLDINEWGELVRSVELQKLHVARQDDGQDMKPGEREEWVKELAALHKKLAAQLLLHGVRV